MHFTHTSLLAALAAVSIASPLAAVKLASPLAAVRPNSHQVFRRSDEPSDDGFPSPSQEQLALIETQAGGQLSNAPPPESISPTAVVVLQLVAFNEFAEVAFFSTLIEKIANYEPGFEMADEASQADVLSALDAINAQEKLHAISATGALELFGAFVPEPCVYKFLPTDVNSAMLLAETFTSLVLGTLQDASELLAKNGDFGAVRGTASVIGQEGEQNGLFRTFLGLKPSQKPFLTTSSAAFAFSALQGFIDSCPYDISQIGLPVFTALSVTDESGGLDVAAEDQSLPFEADLSGVVGAEQFIGGDGSGLFITYLTGQNVPVSVPVSSACWEDSYGKFEADFPYTEYVMDGLSIAALTAGGDFATPDDVVAATLAAPGLIQVNIALV